MSDTTEFVSVLNSLSQKLRNIKSFDDHSETQAVFEEVCSFLRIGSIETRYYKSPAHELSDSGVTNVLYDCGNADDTPGMEIRMREEVEYGAVTRFTFRPVKGEPFKGDAQYESVQMLQQLIAVYYGYSNLVVTANDLTYTDRELGVPNLPFLMRKFGELLGRGAAGAYGASYFNLRHFSVVNNQVGRDEGTEIMKKYIYGLKAKLSDTEVVCRIGGDNFAVLFLKEHLNIVIEHLEGVRISSEKHHADFIISACAGIYMIDAAECRRPDDIMERIALTAGVARKTSNGQFIFYDKEIDERTRQAKMIEDMVPDALRDEEFLVYYQPKVSMRDYSLSGAEALCRWKHGDEMIQPYRFIPVLERSRLICELDYYMLYHVCRDLRRWLDEGKHVVKVSVNLSRVHLGDAGLLDTIVGIIDKFSVPHEYIEIELTETTTDVDYGELKKLVNGLREAGISTAVDDFGVGYSSLNLIRELPWNVLKIDKSFLPDGTGNDQQKRTMLKYVIAMANEIGLECITEGVENMEQVMLLKENGCYLAQGFYFDRPVPCEAFEQRLEAAK